MVYTATVRELNQVDAVQDRTKALLGYMLVSIKQRNPKMMYLDHTDQTAIMRIHEG